MNGIYVEKYQTNGYSYWAVKDCETGKTYSVGDTIVNAVNNYEVMRANEDLMRDFGLDDMDI